MKKPPPTLTLAALCTAVALVLAGHPARAQEPKQQAPHERARAAIAEKDTDGDGRLGPGELDVGPRLFALLDRDGDGYVTVSDLAAGPVGPGPDRGPRRGPDGPRGPQGPGGAGLIERFDADGDGRLAPSEIPEGAPLDFAGLDRNGDGFLDERELASAGRPGRGPGGAGGGRLLEMLRGMDANGDGSIERAEWKGRPQIFDRLDADGNGVITREEVEQLAGRTDGWRGRSGEAVFRRMDADGNGQVTREEWKLAPEHFDRFDRNADGVLTPDELMLLDPRPGQGAPGARDGQDSAAFLQRHDRNGDGQVTREEFPNERRFAEIDTDGNGVLGREEIDEAMDRRRRESGYGFFERFDLDGDGKVTREEFPGPAAHFEAMDRNHDGVIDAADRPDEKR